METMVYLSSVSLPAPPSLIAQRLWQWLCHAFALAMVFCSFVFLFSLVFGAI